MNVIGTKRQIAPGPGGEQPQLQNELESRLAGGESIDVILDATDIQPSIRLAACFTCTHPISITLSNDAENFGGLMTEGHISTSGRQRAAR